MFLKSLHKQSWYVVFYFFTNLHTNHRAFPAKNCATPVEDIDLLEVDLPGLSIKFTVTPLKFSIFLHRPPAPAGNPCFFLNFWFTPLEFQWLLLYPLELSIDILNRGVTFFSGKAHLITFQDKLVLPYHG